MIKQYKKESINKLFIKQTKKKAKKIENKCVKQRNYIFFCSRFIIHPKSYIT